jgi:hypothetical protein
MHETTFQEGLYKLRIQKLSERVDDETMKNKTIVLEEAGKRTKLKRALRSQRALREKLEKAVRETKQESESLKETHGKQLSKMRRRTEGLNQQIRCVECAAFVCHSAQTCVLALALIRILRVLFSSHCVSSFFSIQLDGKRGSHTQGGCGRG